MADPDRFDADPDPTFHADADPAPNPDPKYFLARENKKNLSSFVNAYEFLVLFVDHFL